MAEKFYIDGSGNYIGSFSNGALAPDGASEVISAPPDGGHVWYEGQWIKHFNTDDIKNYRDQVIEEKEVIFNGKKSMCDKRSCDSLYSAINYLMILNDQNATINWKGPDGWYECALPDLQGLATTLGAWVQKAFNAEKAILEAHGSTPYENIDAAKAAFDTQMEA